MPLRLRPSTLAVAFGTAFGTLSLAGPIAAQAQTLGHAGMSMPSAAAESRFGTAGKPEDVDRTIKLNALDISYDITALKVRAGETVRFVITNTSGLDHDFTLGDAETQAEHRKEMAEMEEMAGASHGADANAVFIKAGETRELLWKFGRPAAIEFGCNVPGHYEAGMRGTIEII